MKEIPSDWRIKKFSELGKIIGGGTPDTTIKEYWNGNILWAIPTDITKLPGNYIDKTQRTITKKGLENSSANLLSPGTVLITTRATIGKCAINKKQMATNQGFQNLECNAETSNLFVLYLIKFFKNEILKIASGTTFLEISKSKIMNFKLPLPPFLEEQQKIGSILSNVDFLIQRTLKIIESNQLLMSQFANNLIRKGIGPTKFKKTKLGNVPENWQIKTLSEFTKTYRYPTFYNIKYRDEGVPVLNIGNIDNLTWKLSKNLKDYQKIDNETSNLFRKTIVKESDLVLAVRGATIGKFAVVPKILDSSNINANLLKLSFDKKICNSDFFWFYSRTKDGRKAFRKFVSSTAKETVQAGELKSWNVILPPLKEQQKILSNLANFNLLIEREEEYKSYLENLKKGLMQKLLTGQIRV